MDIAQKFFEVCDAALLARSWIITFQ